ncbi:MAG: protein translocase subunit SecF [Acidobacteria bacterium]|nr:protein translocase subunit SecF [Acidobacteriota bacterium]
MLRIFPNANFDYLGKKNIFIAISVVLAILSAGSLLVKGLNLGVDFKGGTTIVYGFKESPDADRIRGIAKEARLDIDAIQRFDKAEKNQILLRVPMQKEEGRDVSKEITKALGGAFGAVKEDEFDLNLKGADLLAAHLLAGDPEKFAEKPGADGKIEYTRIAQAVIAVRAQKGLFRSVDEAATAPGVPPATAAYIKSNTLAGPFTLVSSESVGPQVGRDLRVKGTWAILLSWAAMLLYIGLRFRKWSFGVAAVVALIHDSWIALGLCSMFGIEISLTVVASFLTLIGYSVNDTVVIFDRVRENLAKKTKEPLAKIMNDSVNQTLSRTILTSALTFLTVVSLFLFGGEVLHGFSFVMLVGIIIGSYSTIFIASPVVLAWEAWNAKRAGASPAPAATPAKAR